MVKETFNGMQYKAAKNYHTKKIEMQLGNAANVQTILFSWNREANCIDEMKSWAYGHFENAKIQFILLKETNVLKSLQDKLMFLRGTI